MQVFGIHEIIRGLTFFGLICFPPLLMAGEYANGNSPQSGVDEANAIPIADKKDLIHLSNTQSDWDKFFIQTADIAFLDSTLEDWDEDGIADGTETTGFRPIGNTTTLFAGSYDGANYIIENLYISDTSMSDVGLFGRNKSEYFKNIHLRNVNISAKHQVGGLVGIQYIRKGNIINCHVSGRISGVQNVGGIIGYAKLSLIKNSSVLADVYGVRAVGGIMGNAYSDIYNGTQYFTGPSIVNSFSSGTVRARHMLVGGLVGVVSEDDEPSIVNSYSTSAVVALRTSSSVTGFGGLVGKNYGSVVASYSTGHVSGHGDTGGLFGSNDSSDVNGVFYDLNTSGMLDTAVGTGLVVGSAYTYSQFKDPDQFVEWGASGLDVLGTTDDQPWVLYPSGRPYLFWQAVALSNGIVANDSIIGDALSIHEDLQETGVAYADSAQLEWNYYNIESTEGRIAVSIRDLHELVAGTSYFMTAYAKTIGGHMFFGDMIKYTHTENPTPISWPASQSKYKLVHGKTSVFSSKGVFLGYVENNGHGSFQTLLSEYDPGVYFLLDQKGNRHKVLYSW